VEKEEQIKADQLGLQQDSAWGATGDVINEDQWGDTNIPPPGNVIILASRLNRQMRQLLY
jgi:hypothetical protein